MTWVWRRLDDAIVKYAHAKTNQLDRCRPVHQPHGPVNSLRQKINGENKNRKKTSQKWCHKTTRTFPEGTGDGFTFCTGFIASAFAIGAYCRDRRGSLYVVRQSVNVNRANSKTPVRRHRNI